MAPKVAVVFYSMYGHIKTMAEAEVAGLKAVGIEADVYQVAETLPQEVLTKMYAPAKSDYPIITPEILATYDAFLLGIPTRYGNFPAQWKAFWDSTGKQWSSGGFYGKFAGVFISTASLGGGQESTAIAAMSTLAHHGIIFVPFGYATAFAKLTDLSEVHGGSPWGAGTFAAPDGSRQPTKLELEIANNQDGSNGGAATGDKPQETAAENGVAAKTVNTDSTGAKKGPEQVSPDVKGGPCGLPAKCEIM